MSEKQSKKFRKIAKEEFARWWNNYLLTTAEFPLMERLALAWRIITKKKFGDI